MAAGQSSLPAIERYVASEMSVNNVAIRHVRSGFKCSSSHVLHNLNLLVHFLVEVGLLRALAWWAEALSKMTHSTTSLQSPETDQWADGRLDVNVTSCVQSLLTEMRYYLLDIL